MFLRREHVPYIVGIAAAVFLVVGRDVIAHTPLEALFADATPDVRPVCEGLPTGDTGFLDKEVTVKDIDLGTPAGAEALKASDGWFVMNVGTAEHPEYELGRVYPDGSIRLGQRVPNLSLLGPSEIPELSPDEVYRTGDAFTVQKVGVSEKEMDVFYRMPADPNQDLDKKYHDRLDQRASAESRTYTVEESRGLNDREVQRVQSVLFDDMSREPVQPSGVNPDGKKCYYRHLAHTIKEGPQEASVLRMKEFPLLEAPDNKNLQEWVHSHEAGHAIDRALEAQKAFNALPSSERQKILQDLANLNKYLIDHNLPHSYSTGEESLADLYSYAMRDPEMVHKVSPRAARFFETLVNKDPSLSKVLKFEQPKVSV